MGSRGVKPLFFGFEKYYYDDLSKFPTLFFLFSSKTAFRHFSYFPDNFAKLGE